MMKSLGSLVSIFLLSMIISVSAQTYLITETCNTSTYNNLCVSTLELGPQKFQLTPKGLSLVVINSVKAKATSIVKDIGNVIALIPLVEKPLSQCFEFYNEVVNDYIPKGVEALENDDPKTAFEIISKTAVGAYECEKILISTGEKFADLLRGWKGIGGSSKNVYRLLVIALEILSKLV
ncbi:hypothetical protein C3L33_13011, partial [Rhododendron williamsianum]